MEKAIALTNALEAASPGPFLEAQLFPLDGHGNIRVTYNWLYSALNCDPNDTSTFTWVLNKTDGGTVTLSPGEQYDGMTLFASVRPDWDYHVQVQAPNSADWITSAGGDEHLTMTELGFLTINLQGLNNQYLAVNGSATGHDGHSGYRFQSNASTTGPSTNMFVAVNQVLQPGIDVTRASDLSPQDITAALEAQGVANADRLSAAIVRVIG